MSKKRIRVIGLFIAVLSLAVLSGCGSAKKKQKATTKTTEVASTTEKENISKNKFLIFCPPLYNTHILFTSIK